MYLELEDVYYKVEIVIDDKVYNIDIKHNNPILEELIPETYRSGYEFIGFLFKWRIIWF